MNDVVADETVHTWDEEEVSTCPRHPKVEAPLRCYQCGQPMCVKCAKRTPVGYLCPVCLSGRKRRFEQASVRDGVLAGLVALILGGVASLILSFANWFVIFLSPLAGLGIAEVAWLAARRHYSRKLKWIVAGALLLAASPPLLAALGLSWVVVSSFGVATPYALWVILHVVLMIISAWDRLK